jgi:hypothetical protein
VSESERSTYFELELFRVEPESDLIPTLPPMHSITFFASRSG